MFLVTFIKEWWWKVECIVFSWTMVEYGACIYVYLYIHMYIYLDLHSVAFLPKNLPEGRNFTYLEDPGIFSITISINIRIQGTWESHRGFHLRWFGKWRVCPFSFGMSPIQTQKGSLEHSWHSFLSPLCNTADGRNFAPPRMCKTLFGINFLVSGALDFFHPYYTPEV